MLSYLKQHFSDLRHAATHTDLKYNVVAFAVAIFFGVLLPYVHIGIVYMKIWVPYKPPVDRYDCGCTCFDTIMKGSYEHQGQQVGYKHIYINSTLNTLKIWFYTLVFVLLFYESLRYLVNLFWLGAPWRKSMLFLYIINLYPHYYSWWNFFIYHNEESYTFFTHHLLFAVTEIMVTAVVLNLCNANNSFSSWKVAFIVTVNLLHIFVAGMDQFIAHVILGEGKRFLIVRDLCLTVPDILHIVITVFVFYKQALQQKTKITELLAKEEWVLVIVLLVLGTLLGRLV